MNPKVILTVVTELAAIDTEAQAVIGALLASGQPLPAPLDKLTPYLPEVQAGLKVFQTLAGLVLKIEAALAAV